MKDSIAWVGLDVHDDSIAVAVAPLGAEPYGFGTFEPGAAALGRLLRRLEPKATELLFAYEAGPFGYGLLRRLQERGHGCVVVAPSRIPREPGRRVKTDRRDALALASLLRNGALTPVWVPDPHLEAVRDLVRCREQAKSDQTRARHRLGSMLRRYGRRFPGRSHWSQAHWRWIEQQDWQEREQRQVFDHYITCVQEARVRLESLERQMRASLEGWSLQRLVVALMALRGVRLVTAMTLAAELGDLRRFEKAGQLMSFVGLTPGVHASGKHTRRGSITKSGNAHVRRVLVESAQSYRYAPGLRGELKRRAARAPEAAQQIAWRAQQRLHGRYRDLTSRQMMKQKILVALARELLGFVWAIGQEIELPAPSGPCAGNRDVTDARLAGVA